MAHVRPSRDQVQPQWSVNRYVYGHKIEQLCGELATIADAVPGLDIRTPHDDEHRHAKLPVVKRNEIDQNNRRLIGAYNAHDFKQKLSTDLPILTVPRTVVMATFDEFGRNGEKYFSLVPDSKTGEDLKQERLMIKEVLAEMLGVSTKELDWKDYTPDLRLAYSAPSVPENVNKLIAMRFARVLPIEVNLAPAVEAAATTLV